MGQEFKIKTMTLNLKALLCSTYFPLISKPKDLGNPCLIMSLLNYHNGILATLFSLFLPISLFSTLWTEIFWTSHFLWCFFCLNVSSAAFSFLNQAETWFTHSSKPIFLSSWLLFSVKFPVACLLHDLWSSRPAHTWLNSVQAVTSICMALCHLYPRPNPTHPSRSNSITMFLWRIFESLAKNDLYLHNYKRLQG